MSAMEVEQIADAVLYEGYNLYPYRPSALKNRRRWLFGCVLPKAWCDVHPEGERWIMQTQCLLQGGPASSIDVRVRFLQPVALRDGTRCHSPGARCHQPWQEAEDRCVGESFRVDELLANNGRFPIVFGQPCTGAGTLDARVHVVCDRCSAAADLFRLTIRVENFTNLPDPAATTRNDALLHALVSVHTILEVCDGEFVSLIDPPPQLREAADGCENLGTWPVLVGDPRRPTTMLSAPIILPDFPQIAPQSPGDLFDGTEIDELLSLRIRTMTDSEKREAASADERTRQLLERTELLSGQVLGTLHGTIGRTRTSSGTDMSFRPGERVRLRPRRRADAFDLMLAGRTAVIVSVECDFEDRVHLAVTIDGDPGADLGASAMPGHRFFFHADEVERLEPDGEQP